MITIDKTEIIALQKFMVPVYLFGIDEKSEKGYFINANNLSAQENLNGISTKYPASKHYITLLWKEVSDYWDNNNEITNFVSSFN